MEINSLFNVLGRLSGIIALISLALLIFSGDTARFFDRFFGFDRIIKFQRQFSIFVASFVFLHPILFILADSSILYFLIPRFYVLSLAFGVSALYIFVGVMLSSYFYKRISYRAWQYIHLITYFLLFLVLYHAFFWGPNADKIIFQLIYLFIIAIVSVGAIYRLIYKMKLKRRPKFFVDKIIKDTEDTFSVKLRSTEKLKFVAGQFCFLRLDKEGLYARHPFTISSAPHEESLMFTVKNTGKFTQALFEMKENEELLIDGPFGRFTRKENAEDLIFIAGGVGITPFRSMSIDHIRNNRKGRIVLLYAAKKEANLIFKQEFDSFQSDNFQAYYFLSAEEKNSGNFSPNRIDKNIIEEMIGKTKNPTFYICGPEPLKKAIISILEELKIEKKSIIFEDFFW